MAIDRKPEFFKGTQLKVGIIGCGYVGLPLGLRFAEAGHKVTGFDTDPKKVSMLNAGKSYIEHIPQTKIQQFVNSKHFGATTDFEKLKDVDAIIICVPTPVSYTHLVTTINSAELIKHASNSFLALKISYANVIADLCEKIGADVEEVTRAMGLDPRIGGQFLRAGLGFGGFCFPKDLQAFVHLAGTVGVNFDILKAAERVNKQRIDRFLEKVHQALWVVKGKRVAILGLAFKANTDDIRFSLSLIHI